MAAHLYHHGMTLSPPPPDPSCPDDLVAIFSALSQSKFRARFKLTGKEALYFQKHDLPTLLEHAERFIRERLASTDPHKDGKQTPTRGHPVFIAQHATATCCRSCLAKWHRIPKHQPLSDSHITHICRILRYWLEAQSTHLPQPVLPSTKRQKSINTQGTLFQNLLQ
ncbi:DUF4186 domain-containing protein [Poriferisphaera sp. WC338]|uniref:DUF4186 domain-containing protein n=1 Tax=Poriferisphaera sp. WC338 TaxID=3425129 RepID=UPI003D816B2B